MHRVLIVVVALLFTLAGCGGGGTLGYMTCAAKCAQQNSCVYSYTETADHCVCGICEEDEEK